MSVRAAVTAAPPTFGGDSELVAILDELETLSRFERDGIEDQAALAAAAAGNLGRPDLELRARLIGGDFPRWGGGVVAAGRVGEGDPRGGLVDGAGGPPPPTPLAPGARFPEVCGGPPGLSHAECA